LRFRFFCKGLDELSTYALTSEFGQSIELEDPKTWKFPAIEEMRSVILLSRKLDGCYIKFAPCCCFAVDTSRKETQHGAL
jgi:hypothetical protein